MFHVFLKQFLIVFKNWEPVNNHQLLEASSTTVQPTEDLLHYDDIVVGCLFGHPAELILTLIEEIARLTAFVAECKFIFIL